MAFVLAAQTGIDLGDFVVVHGLDGARPALAKGDADLFLWERAMTSPLVDSGEFARISQLATQWPSFVFAASNRSRASRQLDLAELIRNAQRHAQRFAASRGSATLISERLHLPLGEATAWLQTARWADGHDVDAADLKPVQQALISAGALDTAVPETSLLQRIAQK